MKGKVFAIVSAVILIITVIGTTLALVYYRSDVTTVNLAVEPSIDGFINYSSGTPILGDEGKLLEPSSTYTGSLSTEIEFWKTENAKNIDIYGHIYLDITTGSDDLLNNKALKWAVTTNDILIAEGNFVGYSQGDSLSILVNHKLLSTYTTFEVYVWLDESNLSAGGEGEVFSVTVRCEATSGEYNLSGVEFDFTEVVETVSLRTGSYKLEVWGAQGGYGMNETYRGGYGGYSSGYITLDTPTTLYIAVGGKGGNGLTKVSTLNAGGYNGGGNTYGATNKYTGSGGGATHIALSDGLLSSLSSSVNDILIVAGGGGGSSYYQETNWNLGGNGGGYLGNNGTRSPTLTGDFGQGGTQNSGGTGYISGSFGQGANASDESIGGGGGFYGGGAGRYNSSGGGGSGYIGNSLLTIKVMYCYGCKDSTGEIDEENIKTISTTCVSETPTSDCAKIGNGYAKITNVLLEFMPRVTLTYGTDYDFKSMLSTELGLTVTYSTYDNANELSVGEYQIRYVAEDENGNEFTYYQKVEIIGG